MSSSAVDKGLNPEQHALLSALTPGYTTSKDIQAQFVHLRQNSLDNRAIFETNLYREEILYQVDTILAKYKASPDLITVLPQSSALERELLWTAFQLYAQLHAVRADVGVFSDPMTEYDKRLEQSAECLVLLKKIGLKDSADIEDLFATLPPTIKPVQEREQWIKEKINFVDSKNDTRLFWVWGKPNLDLVLAFASEEEARKRLAESGFIPSQISWSLYLARGSYFFYKYAQKRFYTPDWVAQLPADVQERYLTQYYKTYWDLYKYRILNDYVWGPINLFCCYWWVGDGVYGWFGDFATCFLLCMDIYLSRLAYAESEATYNAVLESHANRIYGLFDAIMQKVDGLPETDSLRIIVASKNDCFEKVHALKEALFAKQLQGSKLSKKERALNELLVDWMDVYHAQQEGARRWEKKSEAMNYDKTYSLALLVAFTICVSMLIPGTMPVALSVFLKNFGTILCLGLTIVYRTAKARLSMSQEQEAITLLSAHKEQLEAEFKALRSHVTPEKGLLKHKMQELHVQMKQIEQQIAYKNGMIQYQYVELVRTSLLRILVPALIGLTLVYAPASILMMPAYVYTLLASGVFAYGLKEGVVEPYKPGTPKSLRLEASEFKDYYNKVGVFGHSDDMPVPNYDTQQFQFT